MILKILFYFGGMETPITPNPENNLFEVFLSSEGAGYLSRVYRITRWVFILGIIFSVIQLVNIFTRFSLMSGSSALGSDWMSIISKIYPLIEIVSVILTLLQLYFYFNFTRIGNKSIELQQSDLFNESFKWLFRNSLMAITMLILETILLCLATIANFKLLGNMH